MIAIVLCLVFVGGYLSWYATRPDGRTASEIIVREFAKDLAVEARNYRRALRAALVNASRHSDMSAALQKVEAVTEEAKERLEGRADAALNALDDVDGLALRTHRNRYKRIRQRLREAKEIVNELRRDTEAELREDAAGPTRNEP
ncbi:MAG: hypothetical protein A3J75_03470 [Acidobacteria bacterium RBG_16_68_9]|nr:MAG: hypothetical protein A3J75_03470 [Acidobacteria bacterium RBG_16_68_9]